MIAVSLKLQDRSNVLSPDLSAVNAGAKWMKGQGELYFGAYLMQGDFLSWIVKQKKKSSSLVKDICT